MKQKVIVIGAGIGGLATANLLAKQGYDVSVYEMHDTPGGRAGRIERGGYTFDTGPSWYLMPGVFERYYNLLDEPIERHLELVQLDPAYRVFFEDNSTVDITSDIDQDAHTFESIEAGAGQALHRYVKASARIYDLALKHFLYTNFTSPKQLFHKDVIANGLTMARLALTPIHSYVKSFVKSKKLQQILEYPMVFLGTSPYDAPAIYSLMGALDFKEGVYYPQGGIYKIIESLAKIGEGLGVNYHYSSEVVEIITNHDQATGIKLASGQIVEADIIVSNSDLHHTETKLIGNPKQRSYPQRYWDKKQASPSALLMYLGVDGQLENLAHHNLLFIDDWQANFDQIKHSSRPLAKASMYVCNPNKTDPDVAPAGTENLFVLVPLPADVQLDDEAVESLANQYINQIEQMTGASISSRIIEKSYMTPDDFTTKLYSWKKSMLGPSHVLKQSAFFRTKNKSRKLSNLYYVGASTLPGIGLPMCLIGAELVAQRIIKDRG